MLCSVTHPDSVAPKSDECGSRSNAPRSNASPFPLPPRTKKCISTEMPAVLLPLIAALAFSSEQVEFFEKQVRPILAERCYKCHSTQSEKLKGDLLLDSREGLLKGGEDGPVISTGFPEKSKLIEAINYQNPDLQMPPKGKLSDQQIATLTEWVKMGAPWPAETAKSATATSTFDLEKRRREHWAWQPIKP